MTKFILIKTKKSLAQDIMDLDQKLLHDIHADSQPILHLYEWNGPSATHGYFIDKDKVLSLEGIKKHRIKLARRPTGGGVVLHICDLAFSVIIPASHPGFHDKTLDNYHYINRRIKNVLRSFIKETHLELLSSNPMGLDSFCENFCMAKPTIYDVMLDGKKIAGAAQRRKKQGYLHQGTISLALPKRDLLEDILPKNSKVLEAMLATTYSFLGSDYSVADLQEAREILTSKLKQEFLEG